VAGGGLPDPRPQQPPPDQRTHAHARRSCAPASPRCTRGRAPRRR
jgi:hypothetical protein